jgi:hypothetical protein
MPGGRNFLTVKQNPRFWFISFANRGSAMLAMRGAGSCFCFRYIFKNVAVTLAGSGPILKLQSRPLAPRNKRAKSLASITELPQDFLMRTAMDFLLV